MEWEDRQECPDCQGPLQVIKIIDATGRAMESGISHVELAYASPASAQSSLSGTIPVAGHVRAKLCTSCSRIYLYGSRKAGGLPKQ